MALTQPATRTLEALGTYVFIGTRAAEDIPEAEAIALQITRDVDETCSRFRDDSDLSRVNDHPGEWVAVDPLLVSAVESACEAARQTDGLVNPLLGRPLVLLGYDRDFALLHQSDEVVDSVEPLPLVPDIHAWQSIGIDREGAVLIPAGTALDLGATAKAWAADLIAAAFAQTLRCSSLINLGGDIRISQADGEPWPIAIGERPDLPADVVVGLDDGGLATSSTQVRQWRRSGVRRHHIINPRTGLPATEVWRTVTATGPSCVAANIASTAAIVLGHEAPGWLTERGVSARLVSGSGDVLRVGNWPTDTGGA